VQEEDNKEKEVDHANVIIDHFPFSAIKLKNETIPFMIKED
jgi:hypothetical protein